MPPLLRSLNRRSLGCSLRERGTEVILPTFADLSPGVILEGPIHTKVLSRFATTGGLKLTLTVDITPPGGMTLAKVEETRLALRELGMAESVTVRRKG